MILGASYSLVPLIEAAKRLGYYTIAASIPGDYPGFAAADESCFCDITKPEEICQAAGKAGVSGIATCCMDVGLRSLGYTVSRLGLRGPSWETVEKCTNKYEMKQAFRKAGVNTADFYKVSNEKELGEVCGKLNFPLMLKAVDQMGSRGIFRCDTREELFHFYPETMAVTGKDYCIVEEFLQGTMFGVEAMTENGSLAYFLPVGNQLHQGNPPFPVGHYVPWTQGAALEGKIREQVERAIEALGAKHCPLDFDMMEKDGEIYVIEATARAGATCLTDQVGIHFGINYYEAIVSLAMGCSVKPFFTKPRELRIPNAVQILEARTPGVVLEIHPGTEVGGQVVELSFNIKEGDRIRQMTNGRDRIGQAIVKGSTVEECRELLKQIVENVDIKVREDNE